MLSEKHTKIITIISIILAVVLCIVSMYFFYDSKEQQSTSEYEAKLFDEDFIDIQVITDDDTWNSIIENALLEQYTMVDVIVNGKKFSNVGIRPKGNSSLNQIASNENSDRYSFKIKFDEFIDNQTCYGLDTLILNNMLSDNSYLKEYIAFDIMNSIGVNSSLYNFSNLSVNGENFGFYLALEGYNDSFEKRTFNDISGHLYSVKSSEIGNKMDKNEDDAGNSKQGPMPQMNVNTNQDKTPPMDAKINQDNITELPGNNNQGNTPQRNDVTGSPPAISKSGENIQGNVPQNDENKTHGGMKSMGENSGTTLKYTDDEISSYLGIFDNAVGNKTTNSDKKRIITAIKNLNEGKDLEKYFDIDQILRYLAAHTVMVNMDSYSSTMCQNYYLYENNGKVTVLPWDYGLSLGGMHSKDSSTVINFPIDTPVSGVDMADRPLISKLLEIPKYKKLYHNYLQEIYNSYLAEDKITSTIDTLTNRINSYVKSDSSALCSYEEYENATATLKQILILRGESIKGQLDGSIPSTTTGQSENPELLITSDDIDLSSLGSMGGGKGDGNEKDRNKAFNPMDDNIQNTLDNGNDESTNTNVNQLPKQVDMQKVMNIVNEAKGRDLTEEEITQLADLGINKDMVNNFDNNNMHKKSNSHESQQSSSKLIQVYINIGLGLIMLIVIFALSRFKRRKYRS
ncbi:CotH kinase family protein [Anaerovorax odorimutans]|uniref:CotH kinase family protein n=1 Tax=Anaerovorax odorimutans TaxID=109327 RepID=UPI0003F8C2DA|nr:CotH kinase family protein [Anaerovorax odorimutans]